MQQNIVYMQHKECHSHIAENICKVFWLNLLFTIIALVCGFILNSNAILSESVHNLGCTFTIGSAWYFQHLSNKKNLDSFSFGMGRIPLLGAIVSAIVLSTSSVLVILGSVATIEHGHSHSDLTAEGMIWLSLLGVAIKGYAAYKTKNASGENERLVSLHMLADTMGWIAILATGIVLLFVEAPLLDSALSIAISVYILVNVVKSLINTFSILLDRVPAGISVADVKDKLLSISNVKEINDIKIWSLDGEEHSAIIKLTPVMYGEEENKKIRQEIYDYLSEYNIRKIYIDIAE